MKVIYEDNEILVLEKPIGVPSEDTKNGEKGILTKINEEIYAGQIHLLHRLDRNVGGVMVFAKTKKSAAELSKQIQGNAFKKTYLAVAVGEMREREGVIDAPLHRTKESIIVREVCAPDAPDADAACTEYRVLAAENGYSLVLVRPLTGRTHQIRVHFAHAGHALVGDDLYGTPTPLIGRHALHAYTLSFPHPLTEENMTLTAPLCEDMRGLIENLFPTSLLKGALDEYTKNT
jgi:23S rRNA pseudouridine1911/1915/1917 synthase